MNGEELVGKGFLESNEKILLFLVSLLIKVRINWNSVQSFYEFNLKSLKILKENYYSLGNSLRNILLIKRKAMNDLFKKYHYFLIIKFDRNWSQIRDQKRKECLKRKRYWIFYWRKKSILIVLSNLLLEYITQVFIRFNNKMISEYRVNQFT